MESQRTTHILLSITLALVFLLVVMVAKQNAWERQYFRDLVLNDLEGEENPFIDPVTPTTPTTPTTTPTPITPTTPTTPVEETPLEDINLIIGQLYKTAFYSDSTPNPSMKYCGIRPHTVPGSNVRDYLIFVTAGTTCSGNLSQNGTEGFKIDEFIVSPKTGLGSSVINNLNQKYGVVLKTTGSDTYVLGVGTSGLNAYTLSDIYFKTGFFSWAQPVSGFSVMSNN